MPCFETSEMATGSDTQDEGLLEEDTDAKNNATDDKYDDEEIEVEVETTDAPADDRIGVITLGQPSQLSSSASSPKHTSRRKSQRKRVTPVLLTYSSAFKKRSQRRKNIMMDKKKKCEQHDKGQQN